MNNGIIFQGFLWKWTNYLRRYKKRWFVIQKGYLSYYRSELSADAPRVPPCRGMWSLKEAWIHASSGTCTFVVSCGAKTLYLKASNEVEKLRWIHALDYAKTLNQDQRAGRKLSIDNSLSDDESIDSNDDDDDVIPPPSNTPLRKQNTSQSTSGKVNAADVATRGSRSDPIATETTNEMAAFEGMIMDRKTEKRNLKANLACLEDCYSLLQNTFTQLLRNSTELDNEIELQRRDATVSDELATKVHTIATDVSNVRNGTFALTRNARELVTAARHVISRYDAALRRESARCTQLANIIEQLAREQDRFEKVASKRSRRENEKTNGNNVALAASASSGTMRAAIPTIKESKSNRDTGAQAGAAMTCDTTSLSSDVYEESIDDDEDDDDDDANYFDALEDMAHTESTTTQTPSRLLAPIQSEARLFPPDVVRHRQAPHGHVRSQSDWADSARRSADAANACSSTPPSPLMQTHQSTLQKDASLPTDTKDKDKDKEAEKGALLPASAARQRRTSIPSRPQAGGSVWSILRHCIGKELTRIQIPVQFCEPLSFLERSTEDFEYTQLLDRAAACSDPIEQMALVAAFSISSYASTPTRTTKPFNPVLGETYELDRTGEPGYDWRLVSEQVSHHPPVLAMYCESRNAGWKAWMEIRLNTRFRAKVINIEPLGLEHVEFNSGPLRGTHYTWNRAMTVVHNIILGKMWLDNVGDVEVIEHTRGLNCHLTYLPYSHFRQGTQRVVTGVVTDREGAPRYVLQGSWDKSISGAFVLSNSSDATTLPSATLKQQGDKPQDLIGALDLGAALQATNKRSSTSIANSNKPLRLSQAHTIWVVNGKYPDSDRMYKFSKYSIELNEPDPEVAPTDSRRRPDIRVMEEGDFDAANREKYRIEEKQRSKRRECERLQKADPEHAADYEHKPLWFTSTIDPITNKPVHVFNGKYWVAKANQDWSSCPDLF